jgi:arginine decarboxylase-like protein
VIFFLKWVASWGKGYFSVGDNGHVLVHPEKETTCSIDLKQLVDTLVLRGIDLLILNRFADILKHRQTFDSLTSHHANTEQNRSQQQDRSQVRESFPIFRQGSI